MLTNTAKMYSKIPVNVTCYLRCIRCVQEMLIFSFIDSAHKYFFILDRLHGTAIFHPLIPLASEDDNELVFVHISLLEPFADRQGIISSILR